MQKMQRSINRTLLSLTTFGVLIFHSTYVAQAIEFDPGGSIRAKLNLPANDLQSTSINFLQWVLGLLGLVAVVLIVYGGLVWMTAAGNEDRIRKAKEILRGAVIGLVIVLLAWSIFLFVFNSVRNVST